MYNYFVHGDADSYDYAQSNYDPCVAAADPEGWSDSYDGRVGYVVVSDGGWVGGKRQCPGPTPRGRIPREGVGSRPRSQPHAPLGDEVTTYAVVPGATINVSGKADLVVASTTIEIDGKRSFEAVDTSTVAVTVASPGEYDVGDKVVAVNEVDVVNGVTFNVSAGGTNHWPPTIGRPPPSCVGVLLAKTRSRDPDLEAGVPPSR